MKLLNISYRGRNSKVEGATHKLRKPFNESFLWSIWCKWMNNIFWSTPRPRQLARLGFSKSLKFLFKIFKKNFHFFLVNHGCFFHEWRLRWVRGARRQNVAPPSMNAPNHSTEDSLDPSGGNGCITFSRGLWDPSGSLAWGFWSRWKTEILSRWWPGISTIS